MISISGIIVGDTFAMDDYGLSLQDQGIITSAASVIEAIEKEEDDLNISINSCGGDVVGGTGITIAIARWCMAHPDRDATIEIGALCASAAANIIARVLPAVTVKAHADSMIMYHSCAGEVSGTPAELRDTATRMEKVNSIVISSLLRKTTLDEDVVRGWFEAGREGWLTGEEALECGLVSELIDEPCLEYTQVFEHEVYNCKAIVANYKEIKMKKTKITAECGKPTEISAEEVKPEVMENAEVAAECGNPAETPAEEVKAECPDCEKAEVTAEDVPAEEVKKETVIEEVKEEIAEEKSEDADKEAIIRELTAECENLKKELEALKAKMTAGLKPVNVTAEARKSFIELVREIPKGLSASRYGEAFAKLKAEHKDLYDEYIKNHSNR